MKNKFCNRFTAVGLAVLMCSYNVLSSSTAQAIPIQNRGGNYILAPLTDTKYYDWTGEKIWKAGDSITDQYFLVCNNFGEIYDVFADPGKYKYNEETYKGIDMYKDPDLQTCAFDKTSSFAMMIADKNNTSVDLSKKLEINDRYAQVGTFNVFKTVTLNLEKGLSVKNGGLLLQNTFSGSVSGADSDKQKIAVYLGEPAEIEEGGRLILDGTESATVGLVNSPASELIAPDGKNAIVVKKDGQVEVAQFEIKRSKNDDSAAALINVENGGNLRFFAGGGKDFNPDTGMPEYIEGLESSDAKVDLDNGASSSPAVSVANGANVTVEAGDFTAEGAGAIFELADGATLNLEGGKINNTTDAPAINVNSGATVVIPEDSKAEVKSENGKVAIDLDAGSKVQKGENLITVASVEDDSASNYVDNYGNIVLQSGSEDKKVAPNTIIKPDGTAITGNNKLPDVDANGSVTIPEGGAIVTNPDGNKIEVDKGDNVPSIVIGVKNSDGTLATSKRVELGGGPLSLEIATFGVDLKGYSQSVTVDNTNVVKIQGQNKNIAVSPVGVGEATITVTYSKTDAPNDTLSATFKVTVYKNSSGGGGGSTQKLNKVYRAYNPNNGEHLYTLDEKEFKHVTSLGWHDEGVAFMAETEKNGQALYRVYNPNSGLHHYTTDENEKNTLISLGWNEEGIAWYASNKPQSAPVYRVYNPNDGQHHYTVDGHEKDVLVSLGWTYEGIAFKTAPIEK